jgi:YHS domain-containing protein
MRAGPGIATAEDPICGMQVDMANPPGSTSEYNGRLYYFCRAECLKQFEKDPAKYAEA